MLIILLQVMAFCARTYDINLIVYRDESNEQLRLRVWQHRRSGVLVVEVNLKVFAPLTADS